MKRMHFLIAMVNTVKKCKTAKQIKIAMQNCMTCNEINETYVQSQHKQDYSKLK